MKMYFISFVFSISEKWTKYFGIIITNDDTQINIRNQQSLERDVDSIIYNCLNNYLQTKGKYDLLNLVINEINVDEKQFDNFKIQKDLIINLINKKFKCFGEELEIE